MQLDETTQQELHKRLRRIEGQIRGIQQMLADGRECREIVAQVSAAGKALDQVGFKLLVTGMSHCLSDPKAAAENGFDLAEVEQLFLKLA
ncbi:MAG: metal-sensitive transcriptional regulator [Actinomycetota bacterium]